MIPYMKGSVGEISDVAIQRAIDDIRDFAGEEVNYLIGSSGVIRAYYEYLEATKRNVNTLELEGGFRAIGYAGIPMVNSRFAKPGTLKLLNTSNFTLHHMGEWDWLQGADGRILQQVPNYPIWTATLVKYADLVCAHPGGQGELQGITEA